MTSDDEQSFGVWQVTEVGRQVPIAVGTSFEVRLRGSSLALVDRAGPQLRAWPIGAV